jgi:hypothetical protein
MLLIFGTHKVYMKEIAYFCNCIKILKKDFQNKDKKRKNLLLFLGIYPFSVVP